MKLHIVSDTHFEFGKWPKFIPLESIDCDVHVLAGDIGVGFSGLDWALKATDRPVIYVAGNHELWGSRPMEEWWEKAREKVAGTHVHLLENESVVIGEVRFLGCTLWTDFAFFGAITQQASMDRAIQTMNDYVNIFVTANRSRVDPGMPPALLPSKVLLPRASGRLSPRKVLAMHHESRDFLERELKCSSRIDAWTRTVVVTHHAPSERSLIDAERTAHHATYYASHLEYLVAEADMWIHGHVHDAKSFEIAGTSVIQNAYGYGGRDAVHGFDPRMVIDV